MDEKSIAPIGVSNGDRRWSRPTPVEQAQAA
jgi:hypothetical protein